MAYGLKIQKLPADEIDRRVKDAAKMLEIEELLDRQPRALSGGQRQRVAMGRAIVRQPSVFLFDEPLSNLDAKLRVQMRLEIKRLQEDLGITSVYVTHDQVEAMTLGHRLAVLNAGYVEQLGTPIEVYEKPETAFVAEFIGSPSMNMIPAKISVDGKVAELKGGGSVGLIETQSAGQTITFGIRPEHITVGQSATSLSFTVAITEHLGADTLVYGSLPGGTQLVIQIGRASCRERV